MSIEKRKVRDVPMWLIVAVIFVGGFVFFASTQVFEVLDIRSSIAEVVSLVACGLIGTGLIIHYITKK